ncbi:MAG: NUDIX domain-containing protein [Chlamydiales bacterium]|nr:NUDIX domain-containing protein [Chlamydiales bacterium]
MNDPSRLVESEKESYNRTIEELVRAVQPFDEIEACHQEDILRWIDSGVPLCRTRKPDTPPKHLVSYFTLYDPKVNQLLLVNHKKALLWLPPGGHVEPNEHPSDTAKRELNEELGVHLPLFVDDPIFLTVTETVGVTAGHVDVSLWYIFLADSSCEYSYDLEEFSEIKWFGFDELPLDRADPNLARFCDKFSQFFSAHSESFCTIGGLDG